MSTTLKELPRTCPVCELEMSPYFIGGSKKHSKCYNCGYYDDCC